MYCWVVEKWLCGASKGNFRIYWALNAIVWAQASRWCLVPKLHAKVVS